MIMLSSSDHNFCQIIVWPSYHLYLYWQFPKCYRKWLHKREWLCPAPWKPWLQGNDAKLTLGSCCLTNIFQKLPFISWCRLTVPRQSRWGTCWTRYPRKVSILICHFNSPNIACADKPVSSTLRKLLQVYLAHHLHCLCIFNYFGIAFVFSLSITRGASSSA